MKHRGCIALCFCYLVLLVSAWTKEDHEIFRLRDEVELSEGTDVTFYDFLGVTSSATRDEIIKAYRKKSRVIHPDKAKQAYIASKSTGTPKPKNDKQKQKPGVRVSKGPSDSEIRRVVKQANERFARLGVVQDILKGPDRERYDYFLKHGFPKWRGSGYYYARFRPGLGTVLLGLFLVGGGAVHYVALYIGWKRQKQFVDHFVRDARRRAWGDESGITGIPGVNAGTSGANLAADTQDAGLQSLNRRQRRMQDKENRKGKGVKEGNGGSTEPASSPSLERRRVVAENGKVLVVDSAGNVYLEEETEDGGTEEHLLDAEDIPKPTIQQTVLFRLPMWLLNPVVRKLSGQSGHDVMLAEDEDDGTVRSAQSKMSPGLRGGDDFGTQSKKQGQKSRKAR